MKTAISVPDEIFERVEKQVAELGISRSEFFATAAEKYLRELEQHDLTARINAALDAVGEDDSDAWAAAAGRRMLARMDDDW